MSIEGGEDLGSFTSYLTGLIPGQYYYVRAFATNALGTAYGLSKTFTTLALPALTTSSVSSIIATSASCTGEIIKDGNPALTVRGICWGTSQNPTIANSKTSDGTGIGVFTGNLTGLASNTKYYVRAYATNTEGTAYGAELTFTTLPDSVTTNLVTAINSTSATSGGTVVGTGSEPMIARGVCWNTIGTPTITNSKTIDGTSKGSFTSSLSDLAASTASVTRTYYVRAYATNAGGTVYGNEQSFKTVGYVGLGGGYVFFDQGESTTYGTWRYLECAISYSVSSYYWKTSNDGTLSTSIAVGTGLENSNLMNSTTYPAAKFCLDYSNNGKDDWFLPSLEELKLVQNIFPNLVYRCWTSSEVDTLNAYKYYSGWTTGNKMTYGYVLPVRRY